MSGTDISSLAIKIDSSDVNNAIRTLSNLGKQSQKTEAEVWKAMSRQEKAFHALSKASKTLQASMSHAMKTIFSLQGALVGFGAGLATRHFIQTAASFEQMQLKLDAMTKGKGVETLERINEWAKVMPVNTQKAVDTFAMLQAMGLNPTIKMMETLVDTSILFGEDALPRVARALGQIQTLGRLSAEELNQLSEADRKSVV